MTIFPYTADDIDIRDIDRAYDDRHHGKLAQWCRELLRYRTEKTALEAQVEDLTRRLEIAEDAREDAIQEARCAEDAEA